MKSHQRCTTSAYYFPDHGVHQRNAFDVEIAVWLIEQQYARLAHDEPREAKPPLHSRGEASYTRVPHLTESNPLERVLDS